ncbi:MAG: TraR/DksA family transcriptional regulator [Bacteroidia bacterium]
MMIAEQRAQIKAKIESKIIELNERITQLKDLTKPISPDNAIGRISRMDAINNKSVNDAGLRSAEATFKKLNRQLENIDKKDFGNCSRCGNPIRFERLLFMPESMKCISCAQRS